LAAMKSALSRAREIVVFNRPAFLFGG
jgi:hypothetical protein